MSVTFLIGIFVSSHVFSAEKNIGNISFIIGSTSDVQIKQKDKTSWQAAKLKMDVKNADKIRTQKESRCEIKLLEGSVLRIGESSEFEFTDATVAKSPKKVNATLLKGKMWSNIVNLKSKSENFQVKTPTAVCAVRGTIYRIDADSSTTLLVYDGEVDVGPASFWTMPPSSEPTIAPPSEVPGPTEVPGPYEVSLDEWVRIVQGYQIIVRPDGKYAKSRFNAASDNQLDWVKWNKERDMQFINNR